MSDEAPALEERTVPIEMNGRAYEALFERGERNWSASVIADGIAVATGKTFDEALANMREALEFHLEGIDLQRQGKLHAVAKRKRRLA